MVIQRIKSVYNSFMYRLKVGLLAVAVLLLGLVLITPRRKIEESTAPNRSAPLANFVQQPPQATIKQSAMDATKQTRTWVDPYTRKDGTRVKGHWRKVD